MRDLCNDESNRIEVLEECAGGYVKPGRGGVKKILRVLESDHSGEFIVREATAGICSAETPSVQVCVNSDCLSAPSGRGLARADGSVFGDDDARIKPVENRKYIDYECANIK